jgi:hypothetical protein
MLTSNKYESKINVHSSTRKNNKRMTKSILYFSKKQRFFSKNQTSKNDFESLFFPKLQVINLIQNETFARNYFYIFEFG